MLFVVGVVVVAVLAVGAMAVIGQNRLVARRAAVRDAWAGIDVQLAKRAALVPSLVDVVKGYAAHEQATLDGVVEARARLLSASGPDGKGTADAALQGRVGDVVALQERYPDLKANEQFAKLQAQLTSVEDDLSAARRYYNGCVKHYEDARATFPTTVLAARLHFLPEPYFQP